MTDEVFDLDAAAEDVEYPPFKFKKGRKRYTIPNMFTLTPGELQKLDDADGVEGIQAVFESIGAADAAKVLGTLPSNLSIKVMKQWREFSTRTMLEAEGMTPDDDDEDGEDGEGKAPKSSPSSLTKSTGKR